MYSRIGTGTCNKVHNIQATLENNHVFIQVLQTNFQLFNFYHAILLPIVP